MKTIFGVDFFEIMMYNEKVELRQLRILEDVMKRMIILLFGVVLLFSGCNKNIVQDVTVESVTESNSENIQKRKKIEDIYQESISNIELCGINFSLPCNLSIFNDDFSIDNGVPLENYSEETSFSFYYKNSELGSIIIENFGNTSDIENGKIVGLYIKNPDSINSENIFSAGEINFKCTKRDIAEIFEMEDYKEKDSLYLEIDEQHTIVFFFENDEKIDSIEIYAKS